MEFLRIFTKQTTCNIWSTHYPEDPNDVFKTLFALWNDTQYLTDYFTENEEKLAFWGMSIDEAIDRVLDEAQDFEQELRGIERNLPGYENTTLKDIFEPLHDNVYSLNWSNEAHRKGKPDFYKAMLRLYAIELEDGCMIITGGSIKMNKNMDDRERERLNRVQRFLDDQKIFSREGLIN